MTPTAFRLVPCVNLWSRGASPGLSVAHFRGGYPTPKPLLPNWSPSDVFLRSLDPPVWLNPQDDRDTDYNEDTEPGIAPLWLPFSLFCEPHNCMACIRGDSKVDLLTPPTSLMERAKKVKKESDRNVLTSSTHVSSQLYSYGTNSQRKLCDDTLHAE